MSFMDDKLPHTLVYWAPGAPGNDGNPTYSAGIEITGRKQEKRELIRNAKGEQITSSAVVYYDPSDQTLALNGRLEHTTLTELSAGQIADPNLVAGVGIIENAGTSPSVCGDEGLGKVWL